MTLFDLVTRPRIKLYGNWAVIVLSFIAPLYCLIHLPKVTEIEKRNYETDRFSSFLYSLATPFIILYFIILYAYSAKVSSISKIGQKGMISWMVVGFSSFGYLTYIFQNHMKQKVISSHFFAGISPMWSPLKYSCSRMPSISALPNTISRWIDISWWYLGMVGDHLSILHPESKKIASPWSQIITLYHSSHHIRRTMVCLSPASSTTIQSPHPQSHDGWYVPRMVCYFKEKRYTRYGSRKRHILWNRVRLQLFSLWKNQDSFAKELTGKRPNTRKDGKNQNTTKAYRIQA